MMRSLRILFVLMLAAASGQAQEKAKKEKGSFYIGIGFHRVFYTRSDIHFHDNRTGNYDFTLHRVRAIDDNNFNVGEGIDAPQYSYRIGYYFKRKDIGIEISYDHAKYIAVQYQKLHVTGQINGEQLDKDTILYSSFVEYEHTDGANYYMVNFIKKLQLLQTKSGKCELGLVIKPGIGIVLPRSDTRILGMHRDDRYHLAGYIAGLDAGLRYDIGRHFYLETSARGAFANYKDVLLYGEGRASQKWGSLQVIGLVGVRW